MYFDLSKIVPTLACTMQKEDDGPFKSRAALQELFAEKLGEWRDKQILPYCASGYASAVVLLALHLLGEVVPLYDDSFAVWKQDPQRPIEQG